jgi:hypothetical protein
MLNMREEEFLFLELTLVKKARDLSKKRHEREQNFILFSLASVCRVLSRHRSRIIRSSIVVY